MFFHPRAKPVKNQELILPPCYEPRDTSISCILQVGYLGGEKACYRSGGTYRGGHVTEATDSDPGLSTSRIWYMFVGLITILTSSKTRLQVPS